MDPISASMVVSYPAKIFMENKEVKRTVDDIIGQSVIWIKGWFNSAEQIDTVEEFESTPADPHNEAKLQESVKQLLKDEKFKIQVSNWIQEIDKSNRIMKNVQKDTNIDVHGNVYIGYKSSGLDSYEKKNVITGSAIKAGGGFTLGDQS